MTDPERPLARFTPAVVLLAAALLFGGASQNDQYRLALVELVSLPIGLIAIHQLWQSGGWRNQIVPLGILVAIVAIPLVQLVPLPPELWRKLPNRGDVATALALSKVAQPWLPTTLVPEATLQSALALLPPAAMFLAVMGATPPQRRTLVTATVVGAAFSVVLGAAQAAGGEQSPLYFYNPASLGLPDGLFANRNHQALFLLAALPFVTLSVTSIRAASAWRPPPPLSVVLFSLLIVGVVATRSRAGLLLLGPAVAASLALAWRRDRFGLGGRAFSLMVGVVLVALLVSAGFVVANVLPRFDLGQSPELRFDTWPQVLTAASGYLPFGSGVGSFIPVYQSVEPLSTLQADFWNHAHNDYLELWLETGWLGAAALIAFAVWFVRSAVDAWASEQGGSQPLPRAGTIVVGLVLAHSFVDYPIRTEAMATIFALACGLVVVGPSAFPSPRLKSRGPA